MDGLATLRLSVESMPVTQLFGFSLTVLEKGRTEVVLPYRREISFREGAFPATVLGALADVSAGLACMTLLDDGAISSRSVLRSAYSLRPSASDSSDAVESCRRVRRSRSAPPIFS